MTDVKVQNAIYECLKSVVQHNLELNLTFLDKLHNQHFLSIPNVLDYRRKETSYNCPK